MNWNQVFIETSEQASEIVSSVLIDAGAAGVQIDGGVVPLAIRDEYLERTAPSDNVKVIAYYGETDFEAALNYIKKRLKMAESLSEMDFGTLSLSVNEVKDIDWNANFKKNFTTFRAAGNIIIKPTWEHYKSKKSDIVIEMDPGLAFGSGVHETTKMCLELIQRYLPQGSDWSVLDVGCGSGILGIACAKFGAKHVLALDYDNVSVDVTRNNAQLNDVELTARQSDLLQNAGRKKYDIVLANIIADIVIRLSEDVGDYLKDNAIYIVSGIIEDRLSDVLASLEQNNFEVIVTLAMADWRAVAARKNR